ncbi:MAG: metabolite traffic protein EboE [Pirellulaceae bacterium]
MALSHVGQTLTIDDIVAPETETMQVGYCTNIHSGPTLDRVLDNLRANTVPVKQRVCPNEPMGIGLWLAQDAARQTLQDGQWQRLQEFLDEAQLIPHTFNAFPFSDFHQPVVKHLVYEPDWSNSQRLQYSVDICEIVARLLRPDSLATVSTLPLGWPHESPVDDSFFRRCAEHLIACAQHLQDIRQRTGTRVQLCLEPEPGCVLQTSDQLVEFLERYLLSGASSDGVREHIGVCHDVCHAAVMFEPQADVLQRYADSGIAIGKVQISSAIEKRSDNSTGKVSHGIKQLQSFVEPRYLHQTTRRDAESIEFFEDLPLALAATETQSAAWRVHFHVPIHLATLELLHTTQADIDECLKWFINADYRTQFEVETYAWSVSPESVRSGSMVDSIVAELEWLQDRYPSLPTLNQFHDLGP